VAARAIARPVASLMAGKGGGQEEVDSRASQLPCLPGVELQRLINAERLGGIVGIPATAHQTADDHLLRIPAITLAQRVKKPHVVAVHIDPGIPGSIDPLSTRPPSRCGHEQRQAELTTDTQILPTYGLQCCPFGLLIDKGRVDQERVKFQVDVAAQALDDRPLANDAGRANYKVRASGMVHQMLLSAQSTHQVTGQTLVMIVHLSGSFNRLKSGGP
jgi:hypothetical protein